MGGAQRGEGKRKRQAAQAVAAVRAGGSSGRGVVAAVAVVVVLAVVGVGLFLQYRNKPAALPVAVPVAPAGVEYQVPRRATPS